MYPMYPPPPPPQPVAIIGGGKLAPWIAAVVTAILSVVIGKYLPNLPPLPSLPPAAAPQQPPAPKPLTDPTAAVGKIKIGNYGCTATVIGPRREDGRWDALTAEHCVPPGVATGTMTLRSGLVLPITVAVKDVRSDCCWLVVDGPPDLPYAMLAAVTPAPGTPVFHCGFGVDKPGNREAGTVTAAPNGDGQTEYRLSVSSGDSGGGICLTDRGEVLSPVCCTTLPGSVARVWGASPEACQRLRPRFAATSDWVPVPMPVRKP